MKDQSLCEEMKKEIENKMETYKAWEKDTKTKASSSEGLALAEVGLLTLRYW